MIILTDLCPFFSYYCLVFLMISLPGAHRVQELLLTHGDYKSHLHDKMFPVVPMLKRIGAENVQSCFFTLL